jgi:hypothetical protein
MAARAVSVHWPEASRIDGARSEMMDDQNDGHTVDVAVGQLRVEDIELVVKVELVVVEAAVVLGKVRVVEVDDDTDVLESIADDEGVDDGLGVSDVSVLEPESPLLDVVLETVSGVPAPDVEDEFDCSAQDDTDEPDPAKKTFKRFEPPHVSAVFPLHGI